MTHKASESDATWSYASYLIFELCWEHKDRPNSNECLHDKMRQPSKCWPYQLRPVRLSYPSAVCEDPGDTLKSSNLRNLRIQKTRFSVLHLFRQGFRKSSGIFRNAGNQRLQTSFRTSFREPSGTFRNCKNTSKYETSFRTSFRESSGTFRNCGETANGV